ncbi:MAG: hypothetical protein HZB12_03390 [Candidatus Yonathbacteria bacterium]|nr:hypothetical protein [Candidatus Yonathbacteria bacterium]
MEMKILVEKIKMGDVHLLAGLWYGTMIKGTVDVAQNKVALGGDYHIESCELLVKNGSKNENVWGFNIRFEEGENGVLEFDSMVNIKPAQGNKSRGILDENITKKAEDIIKSWIEFV